VNSDGDLNVGFDMFVDEHIRRDKEHHVKKVEDEHQKRAELAAQKEKERLERE
jgi:hypothetical protein